MNKTLTNQADISFNDRVELNSAVEDSKLEVEKASEQVIKPTGENNPKTKLANEPKAETGDLNGDKRSIVLLVMTFLMGSGIILFNIMGYRQLFDEEPLFLSLTPFGLLIGIAEIAVLVWVSFIISNLPTQSRFMRFIALPFVVISFAALSFAGINSYLKDSSFRDLEQAKTVKTKAGNNKVVIDDLKLQIASEEAKAANAQKLFEKSAATIQELTAKNAQISTQMSERRAGEKWRNCEDSIDCAASVRDYGQQKEQNDQSIKMLQLSMEQAQIQIGNAMAAATNLKTEVRELTRKDRIDLNAHASTENKFATKQQTYVNLINSITDTLGLERSNDPFSLFIGFVSLIIYPLYFLLNLAFSLGSAPNRAVRIEKRKKREALKAEKEALVSEKRKLNNIIKRQKCIANHDKKMADLQRNVTNKGKLLKYLRVWAARRTKIREVEKEVEVEIIKEVEVDIVKEVEIQTIVEKLVEVDRIIPVRHEVAVEIVKVEPVLQNVFIPVPENLTAAEMQLVIDEYEARGKTEANAKPAPVEMVELKAEEAKA
ncbi:hypothetical protein [Ferrimonas senticii]|uniref:hypothetical protein n=1 Tax=Ferrimonas senticii TaxID=394566 RepID=UPI00040EC1FF|nr:hypothetical protein [Ferrimonas senticii]